MEEVDLSTITPEELSSLDPVRRAKIKTAIQRQLMVEKLKLGPLQPPEETAGKMPMAPGQLPPTADTLTPKESLFQWSPNSGGMYAAKGGFMSGPPNPKDALTQGLGAGLGVITGGPLGLAAGATAKSLPDLASLAAGGVVGNLANRVSPAKNLILRLLQGGSEGVAQGEISRQARNVTGEKTEPSLPAILTSLGLGAVGKQLQNVATTSRANAKLAKIGEMHQNDAINSKNALEENQNIQSQLNKQVNEARRTAGLAANAVEAKTTPPGIDPNAGKLKIGKNVYTIDKSPEVDLANAVKEAARVRTETLEAKKKTLQTAKDELVNAVAEAKNHKEQGVILKRRFESSDAEYKNILDQLKVPKDSIVRQLPSDYLLYTGSKILTSSAQVAWPLAVIGHILKASTSPKERTISQLAEHLAKKSMTAQEWSDVNKLIPVAVNEMDKYKKQTSGAPQ